MNCEEGRDSLMKDKNKLVEWAEIGEVMLNGEIGEVTVLSGPMMRGNIE